MKKYVAFLCFLMLFPLYCFAAVISPVAQMQREANQMIVQLEANKARLGNINVIRKIVNNILLPHVNLDRMSASVVGQPWRTATPAQRAQFEKEFSFLVTTTYAAALSSYDGDKVMFHPLRESFASRQTMRINSVIVRKTGQRIPVTYDVERVGDAWKVYDFSIENVSMVQSYRSQFASTLASGGMPALLSRLASHNRSTK
ncbi:MAG: ABC transporter substrate-binding protein [Coxiellaceae bacterium]|nr:ABC transporter substrate-binding protein [Coxiellaceae bacterium]